MPPHEKWHTHWGPAPCWICNQADLLDYLVGVFDDMVKNDKKRKWVCYRPVGTQDPMQFQFKPVRI